MAQWLGLLAGHDTWAIYHVDQPPNARIGDSGASSVVDRPTIQVWHRGARTDRAHGYDEGANGLIGTRHAVGHHLDLAELPRSQAVPRPAGGGRSGRFTIYARILL
jgi:hypothetical protein